MSMLKSYVLLESSQKNKYVFDRTIRRTHLCHPIFFHIMNKIEEGVDIKNWLEQLPPPPEEIEIAGVGRVTSSHLRYYYQKYLLLKNNGYFAPIDQKKVLAGRLRSKHILENLANSNWVIFEITDVCNLNCHYCAYGKMYDNYDQRPGSFMDFGIARNTLDYMMQHWNSPLNHSHGKPISIAFYGGEPLMNFSLIKQVVEYTREIEPRARHNYFRFSMTTNGVLLDKHMDYLAEHRFRLLISLDGNERNSSYRVFHNGRPCFEKVMENIEALRDRHPEYFKKYVRFNSVLHNRNSVEDIYHFFKDRFDSMPSISELNNTGLREASREDYRQTYRNLEESVEASEDYSLLERDMFLKLPSIKNTSFFVLRNNDFCYRDYEHLMYPQTRLSHMPTATCPVFSLRVFITVSGKVLTCERIGQHFGLGQVTAEGVDINTETIAGRYNDWYDRMRKLCGDCYNAENCTQCMFYLDLNREVPVCNGWMNYQDYRLHIQSYLDFLEEHPEYYRKILREAGNE